MGANQSKNNNNKQSIMLALALLTPETKEALIASVSSSIEDGSPLGVVLTMVTNDLADALLPADWKQKLLRVITAGETSSNKLWLLRVLLRNVSIKLDPAAIKLAIKQFPETAVLHSDAACSALFNAVGIDANKDAAVSDPALVECLWQLVETGTESEFGKAAATVGRLLAGDGAPARYAKLCTYARLDVLTKRAEALSADAVHIASDASLAARNAAMIDAAEHQFASNLGFIEWLIKCAIRNHDLDLGSEALCALINTCLNVKVREYLVANLDAEAFGKIALILMRHARQADPLVKWVRLLRNMFGDSVSDGPLALRLRACAPMALPAGPITKDPPASNARLCPSGYELPDVSGPAPDLGAVLRAIEGLIEALVSAPIEAVHGAVKTVAMLAFAVYYFNGEAGMAVMRRLGAAMLGRAEFAVAGGAVAGGAVAGGDQRVAANDCARGELSPVAFLKLLEPKTVSASAERAVGWPDANAALTGCKSIFDVLLRILELNTEGAATATKADDVTFASSAASLSGCVASEQYAGGLPLTVPRPGELRGVAPTQRGDVLASILRTLTMLTRNCPRGPEAAPLRECYDRLRLAAAHIVGGATARNAHTGLQAALMALLVPDQLQLSAHQRKLAARAANARAANARK